MVFVYFAGRPLWLRRVNSIEPFAILLEWLHEQLRNGDTALPHDLAQRAFAWTGGGDGPAPPIAD